MAIRKSRHSKIEPVNSQSAETVVKCSTIQRAGRFRVPGLLWLGWLWVYQVFQWLQCTSGWHLTSDSDQAQTQRFASLCLTEAVCLCVFVYCYALICKHASFHGKYPECKVCLTFRCG